MDVRHAYALLKDACQVLDEAGDHAAAAHIAHCMALLEEKYGIDPDADDDRSSARMPPPAAPFDRDSHWA